MAYYVYLVKCSDDTYYCGYTTDVTKRVETHNKGKTGAKYTKTRLPVKLEYVEEYATLSDALKREHAIKKLSRKQKDLLCFGNSSS
jgi:putative endonuclease